MWRSACFVFLFFSSSAEQHDIMLACEFPLGSLLRDSDDHTGQTRCYIKYTITTSQPSVQLCVLNHRCLL